MVSIALDTLRGKVAGERLTQGKFANIVGMSQQSFNNKVNGKNEFTASELIKISLYFDSIGKPCKVEDILPEVVNFFKSMPKMSGSN